MMSVIATIVIGFIVGLIARALKPGDDKLGLIMTSVLGIAGSFVASFLGQALGLYKQGQAASFIASVVGAIILLLIYGFVTKKSGGGDGGSGA
ncbi:MAG: GlsB/YeaQ/YmgE family stress response membrane protein [Brachymonas sp.]